MTSSRERSCHLCECPSHAEEFSRRTMDIYGAVIRNNVNSLKTLLDFSSWYKNNEHCSTSLSQTTILQSCCDDHQVANSDLDILQNAFKNFNFETILFLVEKGFDVNKQDFEIYKGYRETFLHKCCCNADFSRSIDQRRKMVEVVLMLLWYGVDAMIETSKGWTAFDKLIYDRDPIMETAQENLFLYTFDRYSKYIDAETFLIALNRLDLRIFYEITKTNTPKIDFSDNFEYDKYSLKLFTMKSNCLQFLVENFDYVVKEIFMSSEIHDFYSTDETPILLENFEILLRSKLKQEFIDWLPSVNSRHAVGSIVHRTDASSAEKIICLLMSHGVTLYERDLRLVYGKCGRCELFKILLHMDVEKDVYASGNDVIPKILYDVCLDVPKMIRKRRFSKANLRDLSPYFTIPSDVLLDSGLEHVQNGPQVPLLVELARDVFRKYLIERFAIKNSRQFYTHVKLLPISTHHQGIITFEVKLYN